MRLLEAITNRPWLITPEAMETLVAVITREQTDVALAEQIRLARAERPAAVAMRQGQPLAGTEGVSVRDGVAHLAVVGPITRYSDMFSRVSGLASVEQLARDFQAAVEAHDVRAILLEFDTPGGEVTGIAALGEAIYAARRVKPVGAYVDGMAASAGYWLASAASSVTTDPAGMLGSIGAVLAVRDPSKGPQGRTIEFVSSQSPYKRANPLTDDGRAQYQRIVDQTAEAFVEAVARHRGVSAEDVVSRYGMGGLLVGRHAVEAGLADRVGTFEQALAALAGPSRKERNPMDWKQMWAGFWGGALEAGVLTAEPVASDGTPVPLAAAALAAEAEADPDAETLTRATEAKRPAITNEQLEQDLLAMQAKLVEAQERERRAAVQAFVEGAVRAGKALPAEAGPLAALYTKAQGAGLAAEVEALISARPAHALTAELLPADGVALLAARTSGEEMTPERRRALLAMTPEGRAVLAREKA
jgi:capsid assembly protease